MKIIDLLNKIANGEEKVPKEIIYNGYNYLYHTDRKGYYRSVVGSNWIALTTDFSICTILNDEVEILEEEKKIPEKIEEPRFNKGRYYIKDINGDNTEITGIERTLRLKINEIIDCLNYLKNKGDE